MVGNTVVGGIAVATPAKFNMDDTKLWRMRLGYNGEHGMLGLHKRNLLKECMLGITTPKLIQNKWW